MTTRPSTPPAQPIATVYFQYSGLDDECFGRTTLTLAFDADVRLALPNHLTTAGEGEKTPFSISHTFTVNDLRDGGCEGLVIFSLVMRDSELNKRRDSNNLTTFCATLYDPGVRRSAQLLNLRVTHLATNVFIQAQEALPDGRLIDKSMVPQELRLLTRLSQARQPSLFLQSPAGDEANQTTYGFGDDDGSLDHSDSENETPAADSTHFGFDPSNTLPEGSEPDDANSFREEDLIDQDKTKPLEIEEFSTRHPVLTLHDRTGGRVIQSSHPGLVPVPLDVSSLCSIL